MQIIAQLKTEAAPATRPGRVILVDRGSDTHHRYVTAWIGDGDSSWCWGHYFNDERQAKDDYSKRCWRGY